MAEKHFVPKADREYTKADFTSDQMVKWCPGCGDHAILAALLNTFPKTNHKKENICMVSGIGCSSRIPYYVDTYGFHSIHGRACAIATGVKLANPALSVWVSMGDGDSMAIGGNHLIHAVRRNQDFNITIFNNEIYGLTKGQYSPTTKFGQVTKTSPYGTIDYPFNPGELVMGAQGTFYARALDCLPQLTTDIMTRAAKHDGTSVVEVLQNCMIFNDKAHAAITDRAVRDDRTIILEDGKPMIFAPRGHRGHRHPHDAGPHERRPPRGHRRDPQRQEDLLHATVRRPNGRADGQRQVQMRGRPAEQRRHVGNLIQLRV